MFMFQGVFVEFSFYLDHIYIYMICIPIIPKIVFASDVFLIEKSSTVEMSLSPFLPKLSSSGNPSDGTKHTENELVVRMVPLGGSSGHGSFVRCFL